MTEDTNPDYQTLENSANYGTEKISEINVQIVASDNLVLTQEAEKMETHADHLHRVPGKKIWHYFFEFLMLFLAVFCGFMAENWREQLQEHRREKEYIYSIVQDLKSDTLQSAKILMYLRRKSEGIDSVMAALLSPKIAENSNNVYRLWTQNLDLKTFVSNDRTIQQLKNSGELRLIRNKAVSDRIMQYDQTVRNYYRQSRFNV